MFKKILLNLLFVSCFLAIPSPIQAIDRPHFISIVNPIRGPEGWNDARQSPLALPQYQYWLANQNNYPVTWLLRYDAVTDATISAYFHTLSATDSTQALGAFLEITPKLTLAAGVTYPPGEYLSAANRIFLSGYTQTDRLKLIDTYMANFYQRFGYYPQSVGAWHLDSFSLSYLQKHYSVMSAVICDEQYSTDNYRLWGGYLGSPYFPSKLNFLVPAAGRDDRVDLVITKWAPRDPFNFYGERSQSNYSFQVNDYTFFGLDTQYFASILGIYSNGHFNELTQTNIGLENDYNFSQYKNELANSYAALKKNASVDNLRFVSLSDFASWMKVRYSFTNPAYFYTTADVTGRQSGRVYWYQNPFYRIGLKSDRGQTSIIDFRLYNSAEAEDYYLTPNISRTLYSEVNPLIDTIKYPGTAQALDIDLALAKIGFDHWQVSFKTPTQELRLEPKKIIFNSLSAPLLSTPDIKISTKAQQTIWNLSPQLPFAPNRGRNLMAAVVVMLVLLYLVIRATHYRLILVLGWLVGSISLVTVGASGIVYPYGLGLWGPNGHDAIFHLSLIEHFRLNFLSLMHPQLSGQVLANYHLGFDWLTGLLTKISNLSSLDLYFRFVPLLIIATLVLTLIKLLSLWRFSKAKILLAVILVFLSGSAGYIASLFLHRSFFSGESVFWSNQSVSLLLNPPFAVSILGLLVFLYQLEKNNQPKLKNLILLSLLGGLLAQLKIYAFILLIIALFFKKRLKLFVGVALVGFILLLPTLKFSGSPFTFSPLWFTKSMFESFDRLYWARLAGAWQAYENSGSFVKLTLVNLIALFIFYLGNLWLRVIGLFRLLLINKPSPAQELIRLIVIFGLVIPLVLIQKVNPWNTVQFMYYAIFFLSIFTADAVINLLSISRNKLILFFGSLLFILLSVPTTVGTLADYLTAQSASRVSLTELHALDNLRRAPAGVVVSPLTHPRSLPSIPDPKPLYLYTSTAYISALSGQPEYLSDTINLDITGFSYAHRVKNVIRLYRSHDPIWVNQFFKANNIRYVYETPFDQLQVRLEDVCLTKFFDSGEIKIYKYSCHE